MGRVARTVIPGLPHHVTQRGNCGADVFTDDVSRQVYISLVSKYSGRYGVKIWSYCLMRNHVHMVLVPEFKTSLALTLREANTAYSNWFNRRRGVLGHLWQARYYSCVMDEAHLWAAVRYVERNPVRSGIVDRAEQYPWSSAPARCASRGDLLLAGDFPPPQVVKDWSAWLADEDIAASDAIRRCTRVGRPAGPSAFIQKLEKLLGHSLQPRKRGPKPRT